MKNDTKMERSKDGSLPQTKRASENMSLKALRPMNRKSLHNGKVLYPFQDAIANGNTEALGRMLESGNYKEHLDSIDNLEMAPLHYAAKNGDTDTAKLLLDNGASVDRHARHGTPLQMAMRYRKGVTALLLLRRGASVTDLSDMDGMNALHLAVDNRLSEIVNQLLSNFMVDVNAQDWKMNTALHYAAMNGDAVICETLVEGGASISVVNRWQESVLHVAAGENNLNVVKMLLAIDFTECSVSKNTFIEMRRNDKKSALHLAIQMGNLEIAETLVQHGADIHAVANDKKTVLHCAAASGNQDAVKFLLERNVQLDSKDQKGWTPLHYAVMSANTDNVTVLLQNGANIKAEDTNGKTPLLLAIKMNNIVLANLLLSNGACPSDQDSTMQTGLHYAASSGHLEMAFLLLEKCKDLVREKDEGNRMPLHYAAEFGHAEILKYLIGKTMNLNGIDNSGETALHLAARYGNIECVKILANVENQDGLNASNSDEQTALHLAVIHNQLSVCLALLQSDASPDPVDRFSWTPLQYAAAKNHEEILKALLMNGVNVNYTDARGNTALMIAAEAGNLAAVSLLLQSETVLHVTNHKGDNFFDLALKFQRESICKAILESDRWREALSSKDKNGGKIMGKLIEQYPDLAELVLNRSISFSQHHLEDPDFTVTFDYQFLEESPESKSLGDDVIHMIKEQQNKPYFAPRIMSKFGREHLMDHPIVSSLLTLKWERLCRYFYYLRFVIYFIFNIFLNTIIILEGRVDNLIAKEKVKYNNSATDSIKKLEESLPLNNNYGKIMGYIVLSFSLLQLLNEFIKLIMYRLKYFYHFENYIEAILYMSTVWYMFGFLSRERKEQEAVVISILCISLAWANHLLYLQGLPLYRIYVVMFIKVCVTIIKLLIVFAILLLAFSLIFYLLFIGETGFLRAEDISVKVLTMMTGEFGFTEWLSRNRGKLYDSYPKLPFPEVTYVAFVLFVLLVAVAFTNLLIGLAVGDIEKIRSSANLHIFKQQLRLILSIQGITPKYILKKFVHKPTFSYKINKQNKLQRLIKELTSDTTDAELKSLRMAQLHDESPQTTISI